MTCVTLSSAARSDTSSDGDATRTRLARYTAERDREEVIPSPYQGINAC